MKLIGLYLVVLVLSVNITFAKEPEWLKKMKDMKLLYHTREDITKVLGDPIDNRKENYLWYYDFPEGRMQIFYQTKQCVFPPSNNGKQVDWNVPEWTVVKIGFSLNKPVKPQKLNINFEGFNSTPIYDVPDAFEYINDELGIRYGVYKRKVLEIDFFPAKKFDYLNCK